MEQIMKELGGVVDEEEFRAAYEYALQEKHDSLCISMNPKSQMPHFDVSSQPQRVYYISKSREGMSMSQEEEEGGKNLNNKIKHT